MADGGGNEWTEGQKNGHLVIPPVFYRTSALWARSPRRDRATEKDRYRKRYEIQKDRDTECDKDRQTHTEDRHTQKTDTESDSENEIVE